MKKPISLLLLLLFPALLLPAQEDGSPRPETRERAQIGEAYKWDFSHIYGSWEEWEAGLERFRAMGEEYAALEGSLGEGPLSLLKALRLSDELGELAYLVYRYPQLQKDTDTRDNAIQGRLQRVQRAYADFSTATAWFEPELLEVGEEKVRAWIEEEPGLEPYRFPLLDLFRQQEHVLDREGEKLLSYFSTFSATPQKAFEALSTSDIVYPEVEIGGEEKTISYAGYIEVLRTARSQEDRRKAFTAFYETYRQNDDTYAALYNGILQRGWAFAQARGYESVLQANLEGNDIPPEVFNTLLDTVRENPEPLRRYHKLRAEILGLDDYHLYDSMLPLLPEESDWYYDAVVPEVLRSVEILGEDYQAKMRRFFEGGFVDVYENEGKRSGAYSAGVYGVSPYVLLNHNDTLDAAFTLAHEMGHALHTKLSNEAQPFATSSYTIFVAEVAAIFNEMLFLDQLLEDAADDPLRRFALLEKRIGDMTGTFFTQVLFASYEHAAHQKVEAGEPVTAEALNDIYWSLLQDFHGEAITHDELYKYTWTRIPHFYHSPYYVYQYATSFAAAARLHENIRRAETDDEREAAVQAHLTLLKSGGNDHPVTQLQKAGADLTHPEAFLAVIEEFDRLVAELESTYRELKARGLWPEEEEETQEAVAVTQ